MDVLLIEAPLSSVSERKVDLPPLGLAYTASVLRERGISSKIVDLNVTEVDIEREMAEAEFIGVSCYTQNYPYALEILEKAKALNKPVALGGVHATFRFEEVLKHGFDFVLRGEGEFSFAELAQRILSNKSWEDIRGIAYRKGDKVISNGFWRVESLDSLPLPARDLLELKSYSFPGAIATSRGCAYSCVYCSSRAMAGALRLRSPDNVLRELEEIKALGIEHFFVIDPNFAFDKARALEICSRVKELDMVWFSELRLDHIDYELIKAMGSSGCRVVRFGIESGSQEIIEAIKKGIDVNNVVKVVKALVREGITPVCGFMIGNPGETRESIEATVALAQEIRSLGGEATFSVQTPYPDTMLFRHSKSFGIKIHSRNWWEFHHLNPVISTSEFSLEDLRSYLFDALLSLYNAEIPEVELQESYPEMVKLGEGIERKSFRSIAFEKGGLK